MRRPPKSPPRADSGRGAEGPGWEVAIETGLIERLYVWDRGLTETLIEQGVDAALIRGGTSLSPASADRAKALIDDHAHVIEGLFTFVSGDRLLSESYVKELHAALSRSQSTYTARTPDGMSTELTLDHGGYKVAPNSPLRPDGTTHPYCPPEFVSDEMEQLIRWFNELDDAVPADVAAAWLHHRFTQIHPFQDGNGRVARSLASIVMLKAGGFPLVVRNSHRSEYLGALERADSGDLSPLSQLLSRIQISSIRAALEVGIHDPMSFDEVLRETEQSLQAREASGGLSRGVLSRCLALEQQARKTLSEKEARIKELLGRVAPDLSSGTQVTSSDRFWGELSFYAQGISERRNYLAEWRRHVAVIRLDLPVLPGQTSVAIALVFHGLQAHESLMAVMGFAFDTNRGHSGDPMYPQGPVAEEFIFIGDDGRDGLGEKFRAWLEPFLSQGVDYWRKALNSR